MPDPNYVSPSLADIASMTHQGPGASGAPGPNRLGQLLQQPSWLARAAADSAANTAAFAQGGPEAVARRDYQSTMGLAGGFGGGGGGGGFGGTLRLFKNGKPDTWGEQDFYVVNDKGQTVGEMTATGGGRVFKPGEVHVDWLGSTLPGKSKHSIGLSDIRTLPEAMLEHYPDMESISATRVTGARRGPASALPQGSTTFGSDWDKLAAVLEGPLIKRYLDQARAAQASGKPGYAHIEHLYDEEMQPLQSDTPRLTGLEGIDAAYRRLLER